MRRVLKKIANDDHELGDISTMADGSVVEADILIEILFLKRKEQLLTFSGSLQLQRRDDAKQEEQMNCFFLIARQQRFSTKACRQWKI